MGSRAAEKIIDAFTQLLEGFNELQEGLEEDYAVDEDDVDEDAEEEANPEMDNALVAEMRSALEAVIEGEDYAPEEIATLLSAVTEALQEIDPDLFEDDTPVADIAAVDADVVVDDIELDDDEEFDYDEDEDEDEEEEEEEEDDEDDDLDDIDDEDLEEEEEDED